MNRTPTISPRKSSLNFSINWKKPIWSSRTKVNRRTTHFPVWSSGYVIWRCVYPMAIKRVDNWITSGWKWFFGKERKTSDRFDEPFFSLLQTNSFNGKMHALNELNKLLNTVNSSRFHGSLTRPEEIKGLTSEKCTVTWLTEGKKDRRDICCCCLFSDGFKRIKC